MKRFFLVLSLAMFATVALNAQSLTSADREKAVRYLEQTRDGVMESTKGLSEAQWNFKAATNRWSIAEVTEHIAASEEAILNRVRGDVMHAPARTNADEVAAIDKFVLERIPDRSVKAQATEALQPINRYGSPKGSLKQFEDSRAKTIRFLKDTKDLREHALASPLGKQLDAYEWLLFIAAHSERHTKQIEEVKADPNFPKK